MISTAVHPCALQQQQQQQQRLFNGLWSGTTQVGRYQKKHSPTHTHPDHRASFITFLHLQRSMASSLFNLRAWQSSRTTSFQVFFGLPLGLEPSTSCSIHFFTQSSSSFRNTWPYQLGPVPVKGPSNVCVYVCIIIITIFIKTYNKCSNVAKKNKYNKQKIQPS